MSVGPGLCRGGHDHANRQQRQQPERQLVGRNEFDDGSGSDPTGHIVAIPLVTGTRHLLSSVAAEQRMAFINRRQQRRGANGPLGWPHQVTTRCLRTSDLVTRHHRRNLK